MFLSAEAARLHMEQLAAEKAAQARALAAAEAASLSTRRAAVRMAQRRPIARRLADQRVSARGWNHATAAESALALSWTGGDPDTVAFVPFATHRARLPVGGRVRVHA
jgi:hypothetical protein